VQRADELGVGEAVEFLSDVDAINLRRRARVLEVLSDELGDLSGKTVALWGLAFKPDSDDIRDSPALDIAESIAKAGATVQAYDPEAMGPAQKRLASNDISGISLHQSPEETLSGADALVVATEWKTFREWDPSDATGRLVVDGRNCLDRDRWRSAGWHYRGMGRT